MRRSVWSNVGTSGKSNPCRISSILNISVQGLNRFLKTILLGEPAPEPAGPVQWLKVRTLVPDRTSATLLLTRVLPYSDVSLYNAIIHNVTICQTRLVQQGKCIIMTSIFVDSIQVFMYPMQALLLMGHGGPQLRASKQGYPVFFLKLNKK